MDTFTPLGDADHPALGLFYLEHERLLDPQHRMSSAHNGPTTAGLAFLIGTGGLVVTCTHVILGLGAAPGDRVSLFGATPHVNLEVNATVLLPWLGPELDADGRRHPALFWKGLFDASPDAYREDLAFLQIDVESARWHPREFPPHHRDPLQASEALLCKARVLPFCKAGYRTQHAKLDAWCVRWIFGKPDCQATDGQFLGYDEVAYHAVRVGSTTITHGYSGGPLWDARRRTVVGVVRRGLAHPGSTLLATDARMLEAHNDAKIAPDQRLRGLEVALRAQLENVADRVYEDLAGVDAAAHYVWPQVIEATLEDPLDAPARPTQPARDYIPAQFGRVPYMILRGAAGSGKTSLLKRLALALFEQPRADRGVRCVPCYIKAQELLDHEVNLGRLLDRFWSAARPDLWNGDVLADVLAENGAELVLLIDGLDEIAPEQQARLLASVFPVAPLRQVGVGGHSLRVHIYATLVATRPSSHADALLMRSCKAATGTPAPTMLDLCGFDVDQVNAFCEQVFADRAAARVFKAELGKLRWATGRIIPLQLQMAASLFQATPPTPLPNRALDLTERYLTHMINKARHDFIARQPLGLQLPDDTHTYCAHLDEILGFAAAVTLARQRTELQAHDFQQALRDPHSNRRRPAWSLNIGALTRFLFDDVRTVSALVTSTGTGALTLQWAHKTFLEMLAAQHACRDNAGDSRAIEAVFDGHMKSAAHPEGLALLSVLERVEHTVPVVQRILRNCISGAGAGAGSRPQLFAVRALGAGIDGCGSMRPMQVALLIRLMLLDIRESLLCLEFFRSETLPSAEDLLAYAELRADIKAVMLARLKCRMSGASLKRPAVVLAREAKVLELAGLWPDFIDLGLHRPAPSMPPHSARAIPEDREGLARLAVSSANGAEHQLIVPASYFVDLLAATARATPGEITGVRLLDLTLRVALQGQDR